jgi:hypothetical protein
VAAYAECTESQMMPMFGWTDPKMPALYIAQANREKLGITGMDKVVAFDRSQSLDDFLAVPDENNAGTCTENRVVTFRSNIWKKSVADSVAYAWEWCARRDSNPHDFTHCHLKAARLPIPPRARRKTGTEIGEPDQRRRCNKSMLAPQGPRRPRIRGLYRVFLCLLCRRAISSASA